MVEWDREKASSNLEQHGVSFADAVAVLCDELALNLEDVDHGQPRHVAIGRDLLGRVLVVVHAWRGDQPRLISARRATRRERRQYEGARGRP